MASGKGFDFVSAIEGKGFQKVSEVEEFSHVYRMYQKHYERECELAWYGKSTHSFDATIYVDYWKGEPCTVTASFSNGKEKSYQYGKRAYNAIAETIHWNGFEI